MRIAGRTRPVVFAVMTEKDKLKVSALIKRPLLLVAIAGALQLAACVPVAQQAGTPDELEAAETNLVAVGIPTNELSAELLHNLLVAEIAYFRNDVLTSLEIFEKLAFETRDPRIAETVSLRAISHRQFDVASNTSDLWVELRPQSATAWYANAVSQVATQRYDRAVEGFRQTLKLSTEPEESTIQNIGRTLSSNLTPELAYDLFARVIEDNSESLYGRLQLIELAIAAEKDGALIDSLVEDGFAMDPNSDDLAAVSFSLSLGRGKVEAALEFVERFLTRHPNSDKLRHSYAAYLADQGYYREAVKQYEIIADAESMYMLGTLHEQANYPDLSRDKFLEFHTLQPNNQHVLVSLAELAMDQENYEEASNWISRISSRNLAFSRFLLTAKYIAGTRSVAEAVDLLQEYPVENNQQRIRIILIIEGLYRENSQFQQALSVLESALNEFPANTTLLIAKSYTAAELNMIDQVEAAVNAVLAQQPENPLALNALGYTLIDQTDRLEEGTRYIERALEQKPNDPYILDSMGWAHFKQGEYDLAIELLEVALSRRDDPVMAAHLGEVYWIVGRTQKARRIWERARKKTPDSEILTETIERLTGQ